MSRIDSTNPYRVQGPVTSIGELAKSKPGFAVRATDEQIAELQLNLVQTQAREAAVAQYAQQNPAKIYAQVVVDGQVVATVYDTGHLSSQQDIPGLKLSDGEGLALAKTRLDEFMKAVPGKAIYQDFMPQSGPAPSVTPESAIPKVTARGLNEMVEDLNWSLARSRMTIDESLKK